MDREEWPAPCQGAGEAGQIRSQDRDLFNRPWARREISNFPFAAHYAAELAVAFAEAVFELDCEADELDWASTVQERCDAPPGELHRRLPPGMTPQVRALAEGLLAHG